VQAKRKPGRLSQKEARELREKEARELRQEETRESHHVLPGMLESVRG